MTHYHNMLLTQRQLSVMCEICCEFFIFQQNNASVSMHRLRVSVCHFRLLKWETPTFISPDLWLQHPNLNLMNYKICIEIK